MAVIPTGLAGGMEFSPDDRKLGLTLDTAIPPSDSFVLQLGQGALEHGALDRWTYSEVGGLDTDSFIEPELVHYPTFDSASGGPAKIPAWLYKPAGEGPHPVIIVIHGGPEGQSRPSFSSITQMWLDKLGAAVIRPNVRGSSGYGKNYMSLDNGFKREDSVKDIGALLDWLRKAPVSTRELIEQINPVIRGWGLYFCKAHVRKLFHRLDGWIVRRLWSHRFRRWRNAGWKRLPERRLYGEYGLVNLVALIPSLNLPTDNSGKAVYGKTVCTV